MAWKQVKNIKTDIRYTGGWCLAGIQDAFGTDHPYPTAMAQWDGAKSTQHAELPPSGIAVPVFFSLVGEPAGHIAAILPDGKVASTTLAGVHQGLYIHPNIDDLLAVYKKAGWTMKYLGWNEIVGTQRVVIKEDKMTRLEAERLKNVMRVLNSEAKGWPRVETHLGKYDEQEIKYIMSLPGTTVEAIADYSQQAWNEGDSYRKAKDKWRKDSEITLPAVTKERDALKKEVEELKKGGEYVKVTDLYIKKG